MLKKYTLLLLVVGLICTWGCMAFHYPPMEKELVSMWIHREQIDAVKKSILDEGYKMIRENYLYAGAIISDYVKEISTDKIKGKVQIGLSFKDTDTPKDYYRNLGIEVYTLDRADIPEVNAEIDRMEKILYAKLLEVSDKEFVKRGKKEIYGRHESVFEYYEKKRGKTPPKLAIWDRNAVKKKLTSLWVPRSQIIAVKSTILAGGYKRSGEEDIYYDDDTFVTEYNKEIPTVKKNSTIRVKLAFKESYTPKDYYRDLSITILDFGKDAPEVNAEIDRIDGILYQKLIEAAGAEHVKKEGK